MIGFINILSYKKTSNKITIAGRSTQTGATPPFHGVRQTTYTVPPGAPLGVWQQPLSHPLDPDGRDIELMLATLQWPPPPVATEPASHETEPFQLSQDLLILPAHVATEAFDIEADFTVIVGPAGGGTGGRGGTVR